jgi:maleate isomerase
MNADREYGSGGLIGIMPPQANPNVEPEMAAIFPPKVSMLTARLTSGLDNSRARLIDYIERLDQLVGQYEVCTPDVIGFACTGSSYLVGPAREDELVARAAAARGCPVLAVAQCVHQALTALGARRIALLSPYPDWLSQAGIAYWQARGMTIAGFHMAPADVYDTRKIYGLRSSRVLEVARMVERDGADVFLMTGTGAPTLRIIPSLERETGLPVLSSNLCLGWALLRAVGAIGTDVPPTMPDGAWRTAIQAR